MNGVVYWYLCWITLLLWGFLVLFVGLFGEVVCGLPLAPFRFEFWWVAVLMFDGLMLWLCSAY